MYRGNGVRCVFVAALAVISLSGCGWRGLNSLPMPGTEGGGPGRVQVQAQLPDVNNLQQNSRVRVGDVTVGNVTKIERQGWHALITMSLNGDVDLPANATATLGQTSLLGSLHVELAPPTDVPPQGRLHDGSLIPLSAGGDLPDHRADPGGAVAAAQRWRPRPDPRHHEGVQHRVRRSRAGPAQPASTQLDSSSANVNDQTGDIIAATDSLNNLVGQFAEQKPVLDKALTTIPDALAVLKDQRDNLAEALDQFGKFSALAADSVNQTKDNLVKELKDLGPVLESLANAGPGADPVAELASPPSRGPRRPSTTGSAATTPT